MTHLNIPVGISDFAEIRQNGYYYVDKTGLIAEVLKVQHILNILLIKTLMLTANIAKLFIPIEICFADMILVFYEGY